MYVDTHCHLSHQEYDDIASVLEENLKNGVSKMIISSCEVDSIDESIKIAKDNSFVYLTLGYHPSCSSSITDFDLKKLELFLLSTPKVVGIGEIGLDYHYGKDDREDQIRLFEYQLRLAEKMHLPVVIHSRDAVEDTISILKKYSVKGVIHCFSGSLETAQIYIKMGYFLGIGGVVTFKNSKLGDVVSKVGLEHIVLETDSPYLTPHPYRGMKNSSKYLPVIASKVAEVCGVSPLKVSEVTTHNAHCLFDLS